MLCPRGNKTTSGKRVPMINAFHLSRDTSLEIRYLSRDPYSNKTMIEYHQPFSDWPLAFMQCFTLYETESDDVLVLDSWTHGDTIGSEIRCKTWDHFVLQRKMSILGLALCTPVCSTGCLQLIIRPQMTGQPKLTDL